MLKFLIEKECKQILRNSFLPRLIFLMPCVVVLVLPWAANLEVKQIRLAVTDYDRSPASMRLIGKLGATPYFRLTEMPSSQQQALGAIEQGDADLTLEIPLHFDRSLEREGEASVMITANSVNGTKAGLGSTYLTAILRDYALEMGQSKAISVSEGLAPPRIGLLPRYLFNPKLDYKVFMIPALMTMLLIMMCGFLPALNIVGEKESGTIEQMNVTPVHKYTFIFAKLIPYWLVGFIALTLTVLLARWVYGLTPEGSILTLYLFAALFILVMSGFGLVVSNYATTTQQAMFIMFFFVIVMILTSGLFTPVNSMPHWAQLLSNLNPPRYFIEAMRQIYLKGSSIEVLSGHLAALGGFSLFFATWAIMSYRKIS